MKNYRVKWEIDVTAARPEFAARQAQALIMLPDSTANVFDVTEGFNGKIVSRVDLSGGSVQTIRPPKKKWRRIDEARVELVFGKRCSCADVPDEMTWQPCSIRDGLPICEECGEDYEYERTRVFI